jgi:hypothetical protein
MFVEEPGFWKKLGFFYWGTVEGKPGAVTGC